MNQAEYNLLLVVISGPLSTEELRALPATRMIIWDAGENPTTDVPPPARYLTPYGLAKRWLAGSVHAVSLEVDDAIPRNRCVFRCSDGSAQEAGCDNNPQDILNCMDAVRPLSVHCCGNRARGRQFGCRADARHRVRHQHEPVLPLQPQSQTKDDLIDVIAVHDDAAPAYVVAQCRADDPGSRTVTSERRVEGFWL